MTASDIAADLVLLCAQYEEIVERIKAGGHSKFAALHLEDTRREAVAEITAQSWKLVDTIYKENNNDHA